MNQARRRNATQGHSHTNAEQTHIPVPASTASTSTSTTASIVRNTHMPSLAAVRRTLFTSASSSASSSRTAVNQITASGPNSRHASPRSSPERTMTPKKRQGFTPLNLQDIMLRTPDTEEERRSPETLDKKTNPSFVNLLTPRAGHEDLIERDPRGQPILDAAVPISRGRHSHSHHNQAGLYSIPGEEDRLRATEDSDLEKSYITELYKDYQQRYDVEPIDLKAALQLSMQEKLNSLKEDAWIFEAEAEVVEENV